MRVLSLAECAWLTLEFQLFTSLSTDHDLMPVRFIHAVPQYHLTAI